MDTSAADIDGARRDAEPPGTERLAGPVQADVAERPDVAPGAAQADGGAPVAGPAGSDIRPPRPLTAPAWLGLAAVALPLVVVLAALHGPHWFPVLDHAEFELRLRDVGTRHTPLVGTVGRLYGYGQQGNHPGPLGFYLLAPVYRLVGASPWAMQVAMAADYVAAAALALWIVARRGGPRLVLAFGAVAVLVVQGLGADTVANPWNPYVAVAWWLAFVVAVWSAVEGDAPLLPVAVFTGSVCLQSHLEYLPLTSLLLALAAGAVVVHARRGALTGRTAARWLLAAVVVGALLWLPPVVQQLRGSPGNLAILQSQMRSSASQAVGFAAGLRALLVHLDLVRLASGRVVATNTIGGSTVPGVLLVAAWAATAWVAWRRRLPPRGLHLVLAVSLVGGQVTLSRVSGDLTYWLGLWGPTTGAVMAVAALWTVVPLAERRARRAGDRVRRMSPGALVALIAATSLVASVGAIDAESNAPRLSGRLSVLVPQMIAGLEGGAVPGGGRDGTYLVTWNDRFDLGAHGYSLVNELDRVGIDARLTRREQASVAPHRTIDPLAATGVIHLAVGADIDTWRRLPGAVEVAYVDLRTPDERAEADRLLHRIEQYFRSPEVADLAEPLERTLYVVLDPRVPDHIVQDAERLIAIGFPTAVFVGPRELTLR